MKDFLPSDETYAVLTDKRGRVWMGTEGGLIRYNGTSAYYYPSDQIPRRSVYQLHLDEHDRLWVLGSDGIPRVIIDDEVQVLPVSGDMLHQSPKVNFLRDDNGQYWLGHLAGGYSCYDQGLELVGSDAGRFTSPIQSHPDGGILALTPDGIVRVDLKSEVMMLSLGRCTSPRYIVEDSILTVFLDHHWAEVDLDRLSVMATYPIPDIGQVIYVTRSIQSELLLGTRTGLYIVDNQNVSPHPYNNVLAGTSVACVYQSDQGDMWVATLDDGVFHFRETIVKPVPESPREAIHKISEDNSEVYLSGIKGQYWRPTPDGYQEQTLEDWWGEGRLHHFVTHDSGVWHVSDRYIHFEQDNKQVSAAFGSRNSVLRKSDNALITASMSGIYAVRVEDLQHFAAVKSLEAYDSICLSLLLQEGESFDIVGRGDTSWAVSSSGLIRVIGDKAELVRSETLLQQPLSQIAMRKDGRLYMVDRNQRLLTYSTTTESAHDLYLTGLCQRPVKELHYDNHDDILWILHTTGISAIQNLDLETPTCTCLGQEDGLPEVKLSDLHATDTSLLIGTGLGLYELDKSQLPKTIDDYVTWHWPCDEIHRGQDDIDFDISSLFYGDGLRFAYATSKSGPWKHTSESTIPLRELRFGHNEVHIYAYNGLGKRTSIQSHIINRPRPWHKSIWFWVFGLSMIGVLIKQRVIYFDLQRLWDLASRFIPKTSPQIEPTLSIKVTDGTFRRIPLNELYYVKAAGNYIDVFTKTGRITSRNTLQNFLEEVTNVSALQRIHRSYIVHVDQITAVEPKHVCLGDLRVPFSDSFRHIVDQYRHKLVLHHHS
ncbi:MAG: LytTR family transcriptional regulator DNA-binding domain-containing protein [Bacteroidota bacterium]